MGDYVQKRTSSQEVGDKKLDCHSDPDLMKENRVRGQDVEQTKRANSSNSEVNEACTGLCKMTNRQRP